MGDLTHHVNPTQSSQLIQLYFLENQINNREASIDMQKLTPEEEQKIYDSAPVGTWTILFIYGVLVLLGWGYLWARFVGFGAIN